MHYLPEILNIYNVEEYKEDLVNILDSEEGDIIIISAEKMEDIDAAGIQLLVSFVITAYKQHKEIRLINESDQIRKLFYFSGFNCTLKGLIK